MKKLFIFFLMFFVFALNSFAETTAEERAEYFFNRAHKIYLENLMLREILQKEEKNFILGLTFHYSPTSGEFVKGVTKWNYIQDSASIGLYSILPLEDSGHVLYIKDRLIFGSDTIGNNIVIVGNVFDFKFSVNNFIVAHYECQYYWGGEKVSPIYEMSVEVIHRVGIDINIPIIGFDYGSLRR